MITVSEAERIITENLLCLSSVNASTDLTQLLSLREDILADRDLPPFDRVAMDGIAICYSSWQGGLREFSVEGIQRAGEPKKRLKDSHSCLEVMTGASLPLGTDCVVRYEDLNIESGMARLDETVQLKPQQNIHAKGSDSRQGDVLLKRQQTMMGPQWAVAASVGKTQVSSVRDPRIALVTTGDELVDIGVTPKEHQIRRSNSFAFLASLRQWGFHNIVFEHLADDPELMFASLQRLLNSCEVVILSGGVSKGKFDYVPQVLSDLEVEKKFHKIAQRPGKPMWFGVKEKANMVFGLPGNPVSAVVCLHRYVLPALQKMTGVNRMGGLSLRVKLKNKIEFSKSLSLFAPVSVSCDGEAHLWAEPVRTNGSGDFSTLAASDGFVELPADGDLFPRGFNCPLWLWG